MWSGGYEMRKLGWLAVAIVLVLAVAAAYVTVAGRVAEPVA